MICFMDETFCAKCDECKHGGKCFRAITPEMKEKSKERGLPIAWIDRCEKFAEKKGGAK
jgi:hypothetical protein